MFRKQSLSAALSLLIAASAHAGNDPLVQSFERLLTHAPAMTSVSVPANFGADPLMAAMVEPLRDGVRQAVSQVDLDVGGFERMLAHTPSTTSPAWPANAGIDPLIAAMVEPLRVWQSRGHAIALARATSID